MRTYFALVPSHYSYRLLGCGNASKSDLQCSILNKRVVRAINIMLITQMYLLFKIFGICSRA